MPESACEFQLVFLRVLFYARVDTSATVNDPTKP